jgi:N-methylhydantoinase A/oxoprolinase/acetone carboxylase beta subunit
MEDQARAALGELGVPSDQINFERHVDGRFIGQLHHIDIPLPEAALKGGAGATEQLTSSFFARYEELFRHLPKGMRVELLSWRLTARGPRPPVQFRPASTDGLSIDLARKATRRVYFGAAGGAPESRDTPVFDRYQLRPGNELVGPAIVEERESTTVIGPGMRATVDAYLNVVVHV